MLRTYPTIIKIKTNLNGIFEVTSHKSKYPDQLQDALVGVVLRLNREEIVLISLDNFKDGQPVVCVFKVFVLSFDSHHNYIVSIFIH